MCSLQVGLLLQQRLSKGALEDPQANLQAR